MVQRHLFLNSPYVGGVQSEANGDTTEQASAPKSVGTTSYTAPLFLIVGLVIALAVLQRKMNDGKPDPEVAYINVYNFFATGLTSVLFIVMLKVLTVKYVPKSSLAALSAAV